ncbi:Ger(x)C family spore germination protein [Paenibacillus sp. 19GGS1-52]|nr:Ger(x)C family spore germination protein [Paenibacillus sp. 19GGS1-52]
MLAQCLLLCGCWSSSPIEDLNMEVGVALDSADETGTEAEFEREGGSYPKSNKISCTYQFVIPQPASSAKTSSLQSKNFNNMTETGDSIFEAMRELSLRTNRPPSGNHLKIIVIGEKLARSTKLTELIDFFSRDNDIRPSVMLLVSKGEARDVLKDALPGQVPSFVIKGIFNNRDRNMRIWEPVSIAKAAGPLHGKTSFMVQNVVAAGKEPKFAGAGIIDGKTGKLSGFLDESELEGAVWLTGKGKGGVLKTYDPDNGRLITYEVKSASSTIKAKVEGEQISFHVKIESRGRFAETFSASQVKLDEAYVKKDEIALQKQLIQIVKATVEKMQHELHADVGGFGTSLHIQHPAVWQKVKEDWDQTFSTLPVTYEVILNIEEYGASGTAAE